ncbi:UDP-N-acetylglucosamine 2-epimerase [Devosia sp. XGJD_8]|uniref:UDP-N-acetylglucosamine 2-epimerase n=1 Tax=Devosia sp. XGJD_8 TaxID=3391187 RepID=UPI003984BEC9
MGKRRIAYLTGTRADFGLMRTTLLRIAAQPDMSLALYATGMHLDPSLGNTIREVEESGLPPATIIETEQGHPSGALTASNIGRIIGRLVTLLAADRPDIFLLLGDRGEMLAAAIAAIHLNIPIAHIHGGERSGTVDEPVRHAISKLAHLHLVATAGSRARLIRMGERDDAVYVVGAPGLDQILQSANRDAAAVFGAHGLDWTKPVALLLYHPVLQEAGAALASAQALIAALVEANLQILALRPNSDAGSASIVTALEDARDKGQLVLVTHLAREDYLSALRHATLLAGNSSSGVIEAASFGTPVVNVGSRQNLRERNANVVDVTTDPASIRAGIARGLALGRTDGTNLYGDGQSADRIVSTLRALDLMSPELLAKVNAY